MSHHCRVQDVQNGHEALQERWLGKAPTQRTKEEEQAEAAVSGPEPAQRPLGLRAHQPVRTETTKKNDFPLNKEPKRIAASRSRTLDDDRPLNRLPSHPPSPTTPNICLISTRQYQCQLPNLALHARPQRTESPLRSPVLTQLALPPRPCFLWTFSQMTSPQTPRWPCCDVRREEGMAARDFRRWKRFKEGSG